MCYDDLAKDRKNRIIENIDIVKTLNLQNIKINYPIIYKIERYILISRYHFNPFYELVLIQMMSFRYLKLLFQVRKHKD